MALVKELNIGPWNYKVPVQQPFSFKKTNPEDKKKYLIEIQEISGGRIRRSQKPVDADGPIEDFIGFGYDLQDIAIGLLGILKLHWEPDPAIQAQTTV